MKIIADENIPYAREAFGLLGDVTTAPGRSMTSDLLRDADLLFVRSITKVNAALLDGTRVQFVGTATIGEDHVDKAYLTERGIGFSSAPGCNANSVGEYIAAALLVLAETRGFKLTDRKLGIIGHGNVGKRVEQKARALGMECVLNDPPLARQTGDAKYRPLDEIFECQIITAHVPLTKAGEDATYHLLNEAFFNRVKTGTIIINTSRGSVADGQALRAALESGKVGACVLDVWEGEPNIDLNLLANLALATPHIAGYSFDGKVNGTRQVYEAACRHLGMTPSWDPAPHLPEPDCPEIEVDGALPPQRALLNAVSAVYAIREDDRAMRAIIHKSTEQRAAYFDQLRKEYPQRREFHNTRAAVQPENAAIAQTLSGLGFQMA
ncbi:MAG: erythronate-4-phosphate dehydrogenase [Candidatus Hydrogenedentota bacterium]